MPENLDYISRGQPFKGVLTSNTAALDAISRGQPDPWITTGSIELLPDPLVIPLVFPSPSIVFSTPLTPSPLVIPLAFPAPTIYQAVVLAPSPLVIALAFPSLVLGIQFLQPYRDIQRSINVADWSGTLTFFLEVHGFTSDAAQPLIARLKNVDDGLPIAGSEVSITSLTSVRTRSGSFSLTGDHIYEVEYGGLAGFDYTMEDAVLIMNAV